MLHSSLSAFNRLLSYGKCMLFLKVLIPLIVPSCSDEFAPSQRKVLESDFFLWDSLYSGLDFHKSELKGKFAENEILLWRSGKSQCNVWAFGNPCFSQGTSFHWIQRRAFMAAANVSYRQYPVLPVFQPSGIACTGRLLTGVMFSWSWVKKVLSLTIQLLIPNWLIDCISISRIPSFPSFAYASSC